MNDRVKALNERLKLMMAEKAKINEDEELLGNSATEFEKVVLAQ